jgi:hypothetical protein
MDDLKKTKVECEIHGDDDTILLSCPVPARKMDQLLNSHVDVQKSPAYKNKIVLSFANKMETEPENEE